METEYFQITSDADGLPLHCMLILPSGQPRGIVQIVHGMCEYKERYTDFMSYLADRGYVCVIHDNRGHGKSVESKEDLGYFYEGGYRALIEDAHQITQYMKSRFGTSLFYALIGHSMGAMTVRCYLRQYDADIDRLVVLGCPSVMAGMGAALLTAKIFRYIVGARAHSKTLDFIVNNALFERKFRTEGLHAWICSDREVVDAFNEDPLCNFTFTVQGYENLTRLTQFTYQKDGWGMNNPALPIFFASGADDPCAVSRRKFGKSVHFLKELGYTNVRATLYQGMRHELLNEKKHRKIYRAIEEFLEALER